MFMPRHAGNKGNEKADASAGSASFGEDSSKNHFPFCVRISDNAANFVHVMNSADVWGFSCEDHNKCK